MAACDILSHVHIKPCAFRARTGTRPNPGTLAEEARSPVHVVANISDFSAWRF